MNTLVLACAGAAVAATVPMLPAAAASADAGDIFSLGRCIVKADRAIGASLLETLPLSGGPVDLAAVRTSAASDCLDGSAQPDAIALRGAIAQELFIKDFGEFGMRPRRNVADLVEYDLPIGDTAEGVDPTLHARYRMADCAVRNDTPRVERLLKTQIGSSTEMNIMTALAPVLAACQPKGATVSIGRNHLRSMLALSAYNVSARYWSGSLKPVGIQ